MFYSLASSAPSSQSWVWRMPHSFQSCSRYRPSQMQLQIFLPAATWPLWAGHLPSQFHQQNLLPSCLPQTCALEQVPQVCSQLRLVLVWGLKDTAFPIQSFSRLQSLYFALLAMHWLGPISSPGLSSTLFCSAQLFQILTYIYKVSCICNESHCGLHEKRSM